MWTPNSLVGHLLGPALVPEGRTTLGSPIRSPLSAASSQDTTRVTSRCFWLMSPTSAALQSHSRSRCLHMHSATASGSLCGGRRRITDTEPRHAAPGTGMRLSELLTEEVRRGLARGLSSERGVHSLPRRHILHLLIPLGEEKKIRVNFFFIASGFQV